MIELNSVKDLKNSLFSFFLYLIYSHGMMCGKGVEGIWVKSNDFLWRYFQDYLKVFFLFFNEIENNLQHDHAIIHKVTRLFTFIERNFRSRRSLVGSVVVYQT